MDKNHGIDLSGYVGYTGYMINDGMNDVPDKTIVVFRTTDTNNNTISKDRFSNLIRKPSKKRDWFNPHFYRCLPLTIGNQYGFTICLEFDIAFEWNGGDDPNDITLFFDESVNDNDKLMYPNIRTHFGSGILTINPPFFLRTQPGINLMTINPPNSVIPNITVMTGVVETDNLRRNFTFNLKIQMPGIRVNIPAGTPLAGFIPIPRYFADEFKMNFAEDLFDQEVVEEELKADIDAGTYRTEVEPKLKNNVGRHYFIGTDIYGNSFKDHQKP